MSAGKWTTIETCEWIQTATGAAKAGCERWADQPASECIIEMTRSIGVASRFMMGAGNADIELQDFFETQRVRDNARNNQAEKRGRGEKKGSPPLKKVRGQGT